MGQVVATGETISYASVEGVSVKTHELDKEVLGRMSIGTAL